jgi:hypothetical protein
MIVEWRTAYKVNRSSAMMLPALFPSRFFYIIPHDADLLRRFNSYANLVSFHAQYDYDNILPDAHGFARSARDN